MLIGDFALVVRQHISPIVPHYSSSHKPIGVRFVHRWWTVTVITLQMDGKIKVCVCVGG